MELSPYSAWVFSLMIFCGSFPDFYSANILTDRNQESRYYSPFLPKCLQLKLELFLLPSLGAFLWNSPHRLDYHNVF